LECGIRETEGAPGLREAATDDTPGAEKRVDRGGVVKNTEIDERLDRAAQVPHAVPAELLERIADSIEPSLRPVRPLAPSCVLAIGRVRTGPAVALTGAPHAGFQGAEALSVPARFLIFATLAVLACVAAAETVHAWIPGSRHPPSAFLGAVCAALLAA